MGVDYSALFSQQAGMYAQFRPTYPPAWFDFLAGLVPDRRAALDCATGNGQALAGLASRFSRVVGADASLAQLAHRQAFPNAAYLAARSEQLPFSSASFDLLTAAQSAHWFDIERFNAEARRVLRPGGVVAVWCYEMVQVNPRVNAVIHRLYAEVTAPYWSPRRRLIDDHYRALPFPFEELPAPEMSIEIAWKLENLLGYLNSWSAVQEFIRQRGFNPLTLVREDLLSAWGDPDAVWRTRWPVYARVGRV